MDLYERLYDKIESLELPMNCYMGFLLDQENTLCVYPLPGSRTIEKYFDGTRERQMLYEIGFFTDDQQLADQTMWMITEYLDQTETLESENDNFESFDIEVSETPFISQIDNRGLSTYLLDIKIMINQFN